MQSRILNGEFGPQIVSLRCDRLNPGEENKIVWIGEDYILLD